MKGIKLLFAAVALSAAAVHGAVDLSFVSDGQIVPGQWNSNFVDGMAYADTNGIPTMMIYGATDCGNTKAFVLAVQKDDFKAWVKQHPIVLLCCCADSTILNKLNTKSPEDSPDPDLWYARKWMKTYAPSGLYPMVGMHWATNDFNYSYIGRSSLIPRVPGYGRSGLVSELVVRLLEYYFGDYTGSDTPGPQPEPEKESNFGKKVINYKAVAYEPDSNNLKALVKLTSKVANTYGTVAVNGTVVNNDGKRYSVSDKVPKNEPSMEKKVGKLGYLEVTFGDDEIEEGGTLGEWNLKPVTSIGGTLTRPYSEVNMLDESVVPDMVNGYTIIREALPTSVDFYSGGNSWQFPTSGSVTWSPKLKQVVVSGVNPSKLKLSYLSVYGSFKGEFYIFGYKEKYSTKDPSQVLSCSIKRWKVKVLGLVADAIGYGQTTTTTLFPKPITLFINYDPTTANDTESEEEE